MTLPTGERVEEAHRALASGRLDEIARYYHEDLRWLVPGGHELAGWYRGRDALLSLMARAGKLTGGSFAMQRRAVLIGDGYSADLCRNTGTRADAPAGSVSPYDRLDMDVLHLLRWEDGRVVEGRDALFGDDATAFSQSWSQLASDGSRVGD
jgi:uncharacterized protein